MVKSVVLGVAVLGVSLAASGAALAGGWGPRGGAQDYPPDAQAGQCFAKVIVPEVKEPYTEQELVSPEHVVTHLIPGQCHFDDKTLVLRAPSTTTVTIPATYRTVTETVVVRPGGVRTEFIAPVYGTVTEQVMVRPGYTEWRPGSAVGCCVGGASGPGYGPPPPGYYDGAAPDPAYGGYPTRVLPTGEVLCLVAAPPVYQYVTRQVVRVPGHTVEIPYPAETAVVTRQVVATPEHTEERTIPGETRVVQVRTCEPDESRSETIPAEYRPVTRYRVVSPARAEWKPITCEAPAARQSFASPPPPPPPHPRVSAEVSVAPYEPHHDRRHDDWAEHGRMHDRHHGAEVAGGGDNSVAALQGALAAKGYYHGPQNGLLTPETVASMTTYQHANHLPEGRYDGATANALGIAR